jgi:response regulator of citrate/malate metabolism
MRIDLRSTDTRKTLGLMTETVSQTSQSKQPKRARNDTIREILTALERADKPLTRLEVCRAIGRRKSPHLIAEVEHLASLGIVTRQIVTAVNGAPAFAYHMEQ